MKINVPHAWYSKRLIQRTTFGLGLLLAPALFAGCASSNALPKREALPTEQVLRITQRVGGTHYRTIVLEDAWLQTFGSELLVLQPRSARVLNTVRLGRIGETGAAIDMVAQDDRLFVVLDADAVVELNIEEPTRPRIVETRTAAYLGVMPKRVSIAGGEALVSGVGGVVRWDDGSRIYPNPGEVSRVVMSDEGLVACVGRRIYRLEDGQFVGSASDLISARDLGTAVTEINPEDMIVFTRQSPQGALVGLLGPNLRELDSRELTVAVPGQVRSVRVFDERVWVVTDSEVSAYVVEGGSLVRRMHVDILGARDIGRLDENHLAVAGSFGRSIYRANRTDRGPGDTFLHVHREPSRLSHAKWDGRHILAGGDEGSWLYLIGSRVELTNEAIDRDGPPLVPATSATAVSARARINEDGSVLQITTEDGVYEHVENGGVQMHCIVAVEGEFWVGHDRGITVLHPRPPIIDPETGERSGDRVAEQLRLDGPVRYLFPLRVGRGAAYVSEFGGFGTVQWMDEPVEVQAQK